MDQTQEVIASLLSLFVIAVPVLLGVLVWLFFRYGRPYVVMLEAKIAEEIGYAQWQTLKDYAYTFVRAAAQKKGLDTPGARYQYVFDLLRGIADQFGIPATDEQIDSLIEGTYNEAKKYIPDIDAAQPE